MTSLEAHELYSRLHVGNEGDLEFYLRCAQGAEKVLEIGCGWGRIASALVKAGHQVVGIDTDPNFLKRARENVPQGHFALADAANEETWAFEGGSFERILIPYNTLYALGGGSNMLACLKAAAGRLQKGGELWFDVYPVDDLHAHRLAGHEPDDDDDDAPVAIWEDEDGEITVYERSEFVADEPALQVTYRALRNGLEIGNLQMRHDYLPSEEIVQLVEDAGLSVLGMWGDFEGSPVDDDAEQLIFACVKSDEL